MLHQRTASTVAMCSPDTAASHVHPRSFACKFKTTDVHVAHTRVHVLRPERRQRTKALVVRASSGLSTGSPNVPKPSTRQIVLRHIEAFNQRDLNLLVSLASSDCRFEGLVYREVLRGKEEVREYYRRTLANVPKTLTVVVDDITDGNGSSVGVVWHLTLDGFEVPFGRGISFYKLNSQGLVCYVRESPEHVTKLPLSALPALSLAAPLLRVFAPLAPSVVPRSSSSNGNLFKDAPQQFATGGDSSELQKQLDDANRELKRLQQQLEQQTSSRSKQEDYKKQLLKRSMQNGVKPVNPTPTLSTSVQLTSNGEVSPSRTQPVAQPQQAKTSASPLNVSGVWIKEEAASDMDGYDKALTLMKLNNLQKVAAFKLFEGVEITQTSEVLSLRFLTVVPFFKVTEVYKLNSQVTMSRRDLKSGTQVAFTQAFSDRIEVNINWGQPNKGSVSEVYTMPQPGVLHLHSTVTVGSKTASTLQVYRKAKSWTPKNEMSPGAFGLRSYPGNPFGG